MKKIEECADFHTKTYNTTIFQDSNTFFWNIFHCLFHYLRLNELQLLNRSNVHYQTNCHSLFFCVDFSVGMAKIWNFQLLQLKNWVKVHPRKIWVDISLIYNSLLFGMKTPSNDSFKYSVVLTVDSQLTVYWWTENGDAFDNSWTARETTHRIHSNTHTQTGQWNDDNANHFVIVCFIFIDEPCVWFPFCLCFTRCSEQKATAQSCLFTSEKKMFR